MTILEAISAYGVHTYVPSVGMTITGILDEIYDSRDDIFYYVLHKLNHERRDWDNIVDTDHPIKYLSKSACYDVSEVQC